ncbi:cytochrome b/b6 domain-containing protein [Carboxylicivirga caseinilyticus]|uniref:cytochrome b/b6 domain-containing protein n=1 Tax=Carboxylicivirga caseinilyticus TaxID=3417572 RepID=UPI003D3427AF|nr:cytochrome b/b6 domain-containing protein [Marinilabiliaceae bacterium A049]
MSEKLFLYPTWLRVWHALNAIFFLVLLITGISMQYSNPNWILVPFDLAVASHNVSGIIILISYLFYLFFFFTTSNRRHYNIVFKELGKRLAMQIRYYVFGVFKNEEAPYPTSWNMKFNPLQQITYVGVMFVLYPVLIITGIALLFPELIIDNFFGIGGTLLTALLHASTGFLVSMFLIIHLYFATMGATFFANFKSIITGYHEVH